MALKHTQSGHRHRLPQPHLMCAGVCAFNVCVFECARYKERTPSAVPVSVCSLPRIHEHPHTGMNKHRTDTEIVSCKDAGKIDFGQKNTYRFVAAAGGDHRIVCQDIVAR